MSSSLFDEAEDAEIQPTSTERWAVPPEWEWASVSRVGTVKLGRQLAASKRRRTTPTPYLRAANIGTSGLNLTEVLRMDLTERERTVLKLAKGDVVLAEASGSADQVGRSAIWNDEIPECCFQNTVIRFRPHVLTSEYAWVVFRFLLAAGVFSRTSHGVGIQHLGATRLAQLEVPVPSKEEQARIAATVDRQMADVSAAIAKLASAVAGIEAQLTTVIEAAATGQIAALTNSPSLTQLPREKRPETAIAELARVEIPATWEWVRVDVAGEVRIGRQRAPKHEQGDNVVPYLRVANIFEDAIDASDVLSMNFTPEEQKTYKLETGDILLNEGQSEELVGRAAMYRGEPPNVCFQNTLVRFRAGPKVHAEFALLVFRFYLRSGIFSAIAKTSTNIAHLGMQRFAALPFPLPSVKEQKHLATLARERLLQLEAQRQVVHSSGANVDEMRRVILSAAVKGELTKRQSGEETGAALLATLGPPQKEEVPPSVRGPKNTDEDEEDDKDEPRDLTEVLKETGLPMKAEDLFAAARYQKEKVRDVERFCVALRAVLGKTIRTVETGNDGAVLEVIPDATA